MKILLATESYYPNIDGGAVAQHNLVQELEKKGHEICVIAPGYSFKNTVEKENKTKIIRTRAVKLPFYMKSRYCFSPFPLFKIGKTIKKFKPDIVTDIGGAFISFPSKICNIPSIIFNDSEPVPVDRYITYPYAKKILTPNCFLKNLGKKQVRYNGYHEIAYLHPNYFKPNPKILDKLSIEKNEKYIVLRFVSWQASHDFLQAGFPIEWKNKIIKELSEYGRILISSESPIPKKFEKYRVPIKPEEMHDLLYFADLFLGDGATMATEAGLLGTPSIRSSSLVGSMGNFIELMDKYKLVFSYKKPEFAFNKSVEIINKTNSKKIWEKRKNLVFKEKIDVTRYMVEYFEKLKKL